MVGILPYLLVQEAIRGIIFPDQSMKKQTQPPPGLTKAGTPRKNKPGAGGPKGKRSDRVRLNCRVRPETKAALGDDAGEIIDRLIAAEKRLKKEE